MCSKILLALALVAVAAARPDKLVRQQGYVIAAPRVYTQPSSHEEASAEEFVAPAPYEFGYLVDGDSGESANFGRKEVSDGERVTGQYRVELPDCRTQIVTYVSDPVSGYQAEVTYEGEACEWVAPQRTSEPPSAPQSYQPPRNSYQPPTHVYDSPERTYEPPRSSYNAPRHSDSDESYES